ncbi:phosphatase PAP2 family protein [Halovivax limisalsi]|uniref:phosphatase PAP2 family protein n=1 Tax=Halovivax limisalsi TaxID=1453760 RepID=UPI001FFDBE5E|nr:phosphatase PAP2 family protein [Halovivax limisalsi]
MSRGIGVTEAIRAVLPEWSTPLFELAALPGDLPVVAGVLAAVVLVDVRDALSDGGNSPLREPSRDARTTDRGARESAVGRRSLLRPRTAFVVGVVTGGLALTLILKTVLGLPRPPPALQATVRDGYGFPSGHAMAATILWGALAYWCDRPRPRTRAILASLLVSTVALSRLALGVHFLVDVLASVAVGLGYLGVARTALAADPRRSMGLAAVLGTIALVITGATTDGLLAFVGTIGAAAGWWLTTRPSVGRVLAASGR